MSFPTYALTNLQTADYRIAPRRRILPHTPFFKEILALADEYDRLRSDGQHIAARAVKDAAVCKVEQWLDDSETRWDTEIEEWEQIIAARAHAGQTALAIDETIGF